MRSGGIRPRYDSRRVGESAIGTCLLLALLVGVAFIATYTTVNAVYGPPKEIPASDEAALERSMAEIETVEVNEGTGAEVDLENYCRGMEHTEFWGETVKWGATNLVSTAEECCKQCKAMCPEGTRDCECNSWVYCGDQVNCGEQHKQCWLKKQADVLKPDVHSSTESSGWISGLIHPEGQGVIQLETGEGNIRIKLYPSWAPLTVSYIREVLALRHCTGCQLYRGEGLGSGWDGEGERIAANPPGPPYALLQGTLYTEGVPFKPIPREAAPVVKKGHVCLIGEGPDFFISLAHHTEWGHAHTVFGEVLPEDMALVERIVARPAKTAKWGEVEVLEFEEPLSFLPKRWDP